MSRTNLAEKDEIRLIDEDFKNGNWKQAAAEIQNFFDAGITTFKGMDDRGDFSRTHYQNVFHEHFEALPRDEPDTDDIDEIARLIKEAYRQGWQDRGDWEEEQAQ